MPSSTRWRIFCYGDNGGFVPGIAEIEMHTSIGGADVCTGGTATASSAFSFYVASEAFDNNASTFWDASVAVDQWIEYEFASAQDIVEFAITAPPTGANQYDVPSNFELQYWDGSSWVRTIYRWAEWGWTGGETRTYSTSHPTTSKVLWRVYITALGGGVRAGIAELWMHTSIGGADVCTGGTACADSAYNNPDSIPANAFARDGLSLPWNDWASKRASGAWLGYLFPSPVDIVQITMQSRAIATTEAPTDMELQYWDGSAWVTTKSWTGLSWVYEIKVLDPGPSYRVATLSVNSGRKTKLPAGLI